MRKRILTLLFIFTITFNYTVFAAIDESSISSPNIGVYNMDNMELLYGKNQNEKISIASITKVMTAIVAIENITDINEKVNIDYTIISEKIDSELSVAGIYDGETLTYYDLLCTMLIPSGADSAMYLACSIFESEDMFIQKMNDKAREIGMSSTSFSNPTGLDDENNYSTINDVAKMMRYALNNQILKEIMSLKEYTTTDENITVNNTIFRSATRYGVDVQNIIGGKTGTTEDAGLCLASFSEDEGVNLLAIVTGSSMYSSSPYNLIDTEYLYEKIKEDYSIQTIISSGTPIYELPSTCTKQDSVTIYAKEDISAYVENIDTDKITIDYSGIDMLDYTIKQGEKVGTLSIYYNGKLVKEMDVTIDEKLDFSVLKWMNLNKGVIAFFAVIIAGIVSLILIFTLKIRKKK